jgi:molybdenum cofactor cytidylyltransferase
MVAGDAAVVVAGVVLAAGSSSRLGRPKQLLDAGGVPLIRRVVAEVLASRAAPVAVIVGAHAEAVTAALAGLEVASIVNPDHGEGVASSVRAAAAFAERCGAGGLLLAVCDQPRLDRAHLDALIAAFDGAAPVASAYGGTVGVPAIVPRAALPRLAALRGDHGARALLRDDPATRALPWPDGALDLDTPDAVRAWNR